MKLNGEMLESLYGHSIIDVTSPDETKTKKPLIFFRDASHTRLPDKQYRFLEQILKACKLNITDVDIINLADKKNRPRKDR